MVNVRLMERRFQLLQVDDLLVQHVFFQGFLSDLNRKAAGFPFFGQHIPYLGQRIIGRLVRWLGQELSHAIADAEGRFVG